MGITSISRLLYAIIRLLQLILTAALDLSSP